MREPDGPGEGKVPPGFLERAVFSSLGKKRRSLLVGPGHGMDNAVVAVGTRKVILATCDPISVIPSLGARESARLSVHLIASDLATSGVSPQFAMFDLNLPPEMGLVPAAAYSRALGDECAKLGVSIVGGHTGMYPGSGYTVVGGGMMFSVAGSGSYVTPAMAREGDSLLVTKGAAIGATAVLAHSFPETVGRRVGRSLLRKAKSRIRDCSTVRDSAAAASVGLRRSVTSMHDATEGGVLGGLRELSLACGQPVVVDREKIDVPEEAGAVCAAFGLDPLTTLSEGTLLIACRPRAIGEVLDALSREGIHAMEIGVVGGRGAGKGPGLWVSSGGSPARQSVPPRDRYWAAYSTAKKSGLR